MSRRIRRVAALTTGGALVAAAMIAAAPAAAQQSPAPALAPFYTELDLTGDGIVTEADLGLLAAALGATPEDDAWLPGADIDGDGVITVADLAALSARMVYDDGPFELVEASVMDMQAAMNAGVTTSAEITQEYLERIAAYDRALVDPGEGGRPLNAIIATNDDALAAAAAADAVREEQGMTSTLLGVPVALKDNINTADMPTTAGCGCWSDNQTATDAPMVEGLREAGAVILAKAGLDEFAFGFQSQFTVGVEPGSALFIASPYHTERTAGGSSGGTGAAVAANLAGIGFGTDTGGSIRVPASYNQLVGIRPTVGLASRDGVVPLALSQDTAGPMTRSVMDAAIALDTMVGIDPADPVTETQAGRVPDSYTSFLDADALDGARIGYFPSMIPTNRTSARLWEETRELLQEQGATVVELTPPAGFSAILAEPSGSTNEFRHDLELYVDAHLAPEVEARSIEAIIDTGHFVTSRAGTYRSRAAVTDEQYEAWAGENGSHTLQLAAGKATMHELMDEENLDAIAYPSGTPYGTYSWNMRLSPNTGMPALSVPMGQAIDEDGTIAGAGVNLELLGRDFDEGTLLALAYALEQQLDARTAPELYGPLG